MLEMTLSVENGCVLFISVVVGVSRVTISGRFLLS